MCLYLSLLVAKALTSVRISIHRLVRAFVDSFKNVYHMTSRLGVI